MKIICFLSTFSGPSGRFRFLQYEKKFKELGVDVVYTSIFPRRHFQIKNKFFGFYFSKFIEPIRMISVLLNGLRLPFYDVVFLNKDLSPSVRFFWYEKYFRFMNKNLFFDLDDAIFFGEGGLREKKFKEIFPLFKGIITSNNYLAEYIKKYSEKIKVIPMGIDLDKYLLKKSLKPSVTTIGWSGSDRSYDVTFPSVINAIKKVSKQRKIQLIIIKNTDPLLKIDGVNVKFIQWTKESEVQMLRKIDIGIMPLTNDKFQKYKSALKALQYMALSKPALVSPIGVNKEIVIHGKHGYHCKTESDWVKNMIKLIDNPKLCVNMGVSGRKKIEKEHSLNVLIDDYIDFFRS